MPLCLSQKGTGLDTCLKQKGGLDICRVLFRTGSGFRGTRQEDPLVGYSFQWTVYNVSLFQWTVYVSMDGLRLNGTFSFKLTVCLSWQDGTSCPRDETRRSACEVFV